MKEFVEKIVNEQKDKVSTFGKPLYYPVDLTLVNGNILLRAFRIIDIDGSKIKGITWKEEYCAPRESRKEVYSYFDLDEIAGLSCLNSCICTECGNWSFSESFTRASGDICQLTSRSFFYLLHFTSLINFQIAPYCTP